MKSNFLKISENIAFLLIFLTIIISLSLTLITGCNEAGENGDESTPFSSASRKIFVANGEGDTISIFDAQADGNAAPLRTIGSRTGLIRPMAIHVDSKNNELFVAHTEKNRITVFKSTDEGDVFPLRTIEGGNSGLFLPTSLFVDTKNDELFVANIDSINVYDRNVNGNSPPKRTIRLEGFIVIFGIYVDTNNDELFVTGFDCENLVGIVNVFPRNADEEASPKRIIKILEVTDEDFAFFPTSITVDEINDEFLVVGAGIAITGSGCLTPLLGVTPQPVQETFDSAIFVFLRTAEEGDFPLRTIRGENTQLFQPFGISVDATNDEIFVVNFANNSVSVYERTADGTEVQPLRVLFIVDSNNAGFLARRNMSSGISLDIDNEELYVSNRNNTILVYKGTDEQDALPLRIIGPRSGLLNPQWIHVDIEQNEILVTNAISRLVTVHSITTDDGSTPPLKTFPQGILALVGIYLDIENNEVFITNTGTTDAVRVHDRINNIPKRDLFGENTGLSNPTGIFVDTERDEMFVVNSGNNTITVYSREAQDNEEPLRIINKGLFNPQGIFVDTAHNEIYVTNRGDPFEFMNPIEPTITVYRREAVENEEPIKTISKGLFDPRGIFVDIEHNEIFVSNFGDPTNPFFPVESTITVYRRGAGEDEEPIRIIEGPDTGLDGSVGIFVAESP